MRSLLSVRRSALSAVAHGSQFLAIALTLVTALLLPSCGGGGGDKTPTAPVMVLTTVTVSLSATTVQVGQAATASATGADQNGASISTGTVTWSSSSPAVATVTAGGAIIAVAAGQTTIVATAGSKSGLATLTVIPVPVASVTVAPSTATIFIGATQQLTAATLDANNAALTGRTVTWNSSDPTKATVSSSGLVTAVAAGTSTISASSEGKSGSAAVTVVSPVATVVITGSKTVKVGDTYTYSATARLADGTVISRPMTWTILETTKGTMTPAGSLTTSQTGAITLQVSIDGTIWTGSTTSYDWEALSSGGSSFQSLSSDTPITNKYGTSVLPELVVSCGSSGYFFVWVRVPNFVTSSGLVSYSFDSGVISSMLWGELSPSYNTLWYPGSNTAIKAFASSIASARTFAFAFTEYLGTAKAMMFRVTGLASRLAPLIAACPGSALLAESASSHLELMNSLGKTEAVTSEAIANRQLRQLRGAEDVPAPSLDQSLPVVNTQKAVRRPR